MPFKKISKGVTIGVIKPPVQPSNETKSEDTDKDKPAEKNKQCQ